MIAAIVSATQIGQKVAARVLHSDMSTLCILVDAGPTGARPTYTCHDHSEMTQCRHFAHRALSHESHPSGFSRLSAHLGDIVERNSRLRRHFACPFGGALF